MTELKKCKLCGSKAGYSTYADGTPHIVFCEKTSCQMNKPSFSPEEWNTLNDDQAEQLASQKEYYEQVFKDGEKQIASWKARAEKSEVQSSLPDFDDIKDILGIPNFRCGPMARMLREIGHEIPCKAEDEQAYVLHFLLGYWKEFGGNWRQEANEFVKNELEKLKTQTP